MCNQSMFFFPLQSMPYDSTCCYPGDMVPIENDGDVRWCSIGKTVFDMKFVPIDSVHGTLLNVMSYSGWNLGAQSV